MILNLVKVPVQGLCMISNLLCLIYIKDTDNNKSVEEKENKSVYSVREGMYFFFLYLVAKHFMLSKLTFND